MTATAELRSNETASRSHVLGVDVHLLTRDELTQIAVRAVDRNEQAIIGNHNLHSVYLFHVNETMQRFYSVAKWIHVDGMPLIWLARAAGHKVERQHRVAYLDWIDQLLTEAETRSWKVFLLGGKPELREKTAALFRNQYPGIKFHHQDGYFGADDNEAVVARIEAIQPNLLFVGMGMPKQEEWIFNHRSRLGPAVILPCGACFDYLVGAIATAPRWLGQLGLEWLFRVCHEPARLWKRYFLEPVLLVGILLSRSARQARAGQPR